MNTDPHIVTSSEWKDPCGIQYRIVQTTITRVEVSHPGFINPGWVPLPKELQTEALAARASELGKSIRK